MKSTSLLKTITLLGVILLAAAAAQAAFRTDKLAEIDMAITTAIGESKCPGGVFWLERGADRYYKAYGRRAVIPADEVMTEDTIFDAASLTKVIACTPAVLLLVERGQIGLDDAVAKHLPEFAAHGKEGITIRQLLTHTSGLRPDISLKPDWTGAAEAIRLSCAEKLSAAPGGKIIYSDTGMILLAEIVRRISGQIARCVSADRSVRTARNVGHRLQSP
jgi:CubicO group peptidase (beta-lactamase class C family)